MTDRELIEMAAKAAGVALEYRRGSDAHYYDDPETGREQWAPLDNDGQALRLAVTLGVGVQCHMTDGQGYALASSGDENSIAMNISRGEDPYAATRRAITRAAAAIGGAR